MKHKKGSLDVLQQSFNKDVKNAIDNLRLGHREDTLSDLANLIVKAGALIDAISKDLTKNK